VNKEWLDATAAGDTHRVGALLDAGANIDALDNHSQTALMNAAHRGDAVLVRLLVARGANLNHTAKYRLTALMLAVINDRVDVVRTLVAAGADREIRGSRGFFARTPLEYAEEHGQTHLATILRDGA
jgi:hypothetical protein